MEEFNSNQTNLPPEPYPYYSPPPNWGDYLPPPSFSRKRLHPDELTTEFKKLRLDPSVKSLEPPTPPSVTTISTPESYFTLDEKYRTLTNRIPDTILRPTLKDEEEYLQSRRLVPYRPNFWKVLFDRLFYPEKFPTSTYTTNSRTTQWSSSNHFRPPSDYSMDEDDNYDPLPPSSSSGWAPMELE